MIVIEHHTTWMEALNHETSNLSNQYIARTFFGLVINEKFVVSFAAIMKKQGTFVDSLESMGSYLRDLPASYDAAKELLQYVIGQSHQFNENEICPIAAVNLLPPVPNPAALIDFGLTPRHLRNAGVNLLQREYTGPEREELKRKIAEKFQQDPNKVNFSYYKCNHNALIGDGDTIHWPSYSSYLDIEPELAFVTGKGIALQVMLFLTTVLSAMCSGRISRR